MRAAKTNILLKCAVCDSKKSRFIKEQETSKLLLGPNLPLQNSYIG